MTEVIEKTENKKGYKKTKLGWIPEEWEVVKLGNIATEIKDKVGTKQRTPMSLSAGKGFVAQAKKFGKDIAGKQYAQYTCLPPRTFAYNKGNSLKYPQGCIYQQPFDEEVFVLHWTKIVATITFMNNYLKIMHKAKNFLNI